MLIYMTLIKITNKAILTWLTQINSMFNDDGVDNDLRNREYAYRPN